MYKKSKMADGRNFKNHKSLTISLIKLQNLCEQTCYQFLFVVKSGCFKTSNINSAQSAKVKFCI